MCFDYDIYVCLSIVYCLWMCYENDLCYNIVVVIILKKALFESGNVWIFRNIIIERYNKTELYMIVLIHVLNLFNGQ